MIVSRPFALIAIAGVPCYSEHHFLSHGNLLMGIENS